VVSCDKDDKSAECQKAWNDFWEEHYYPEEYKGSSVSSVGQNHKTYSEMIADGYEMTADGFWFKESKKEDKIKKWILPVEEVKDEDTDEYIYCVSFPDDLLEAANLKEGDFVEWVGSR
jgi:hypothetical protein